MENNRGQWASNFGFLMAAVGSAVGLGNIWGFPYKMGSNGGFAFLLIYLILVVLCGFVVMLGELTIGRMTGKSTVFAYTELSKKYTWIGFMGVASGFVILAFYSVLGGFVTKYFISFLGEFLKLPFGFNGASSGDYFGAFILNGPQTVIFHLIFMLFTIVIVMGGISGGIEKFSKVAMPALAVMLLIVIIRGITLPGAGAGLAFMFKPDFSVFSNPEIGFWKVLRAAAGQMFFSLSLGMGCMITYGSYLSKKESLERNAVIIPIADTIFALCAGLAVMPAVFAFGLEPTGGPSLLFVTLHEVFMSMGVIGPIFGMIFYLLVVIAAVTSSISLLEVCTSYMVDRKTLKGEKPNRKRIALIIGAIIFVIGLPVALDGLGSPGAVMEGLVFGKWIWLDFYDLLSEGIMMPFGALLMCLIMGWHIKMDRLGKEICVDGNSFKSKGFIDICAKFITPIIMIFILVTQVMSFFGA